jgi:MFS family permease
VWPGMRSSTSSEPRLLTRPFVLLCTASCLGALSPNLFLVAPRYLRGLGRTEGVIGAIMGIFPLASLLTMPLVGAAAARLGRRAPMMAGMLLCALGAILFSLSTATPALLAARAVAGAGWAGVLVSASITATDLAPPGRLAQAIGVAGVLTLAAMALGPSIGETLAAHAGYDAVFSAAAITALLGALVAVALPDRAGPRTTDVGRGWRVGTRRHLVAVFLVAMGFGGVVAFLSDHVGLLHLGGIAPFFNAYVATAILARVFCGNLSDRVGRARVVAPALAGQALAMTGIALLSAAWQLPVLGILFGFTHGLYYPALQALILDRAPDARARAVAACNVAFSSGMAASAFGNGALADVLGYRAAYAVCAAGAAVAAVLVVTGSRRGTTS